MELKRVLINPHLKWAIEPGHLGSIKYLDGLQGAVKRVPDVGEVLTLDFMVDPETLVPCPVRVTRIQYQDFAGYTLVIPVVVRWRSD